MAKKSAVSLTKDDFEDKKFKIAPGGRYKVKVSKGSPKTTTVKAGASGDNLQVHATITSGKHKGVSFFDVIGASVGWKIAQILKAVGMNYATAIKKVKTLQDLLTLVAGKELEAVLRATEYNGKPKNEVVQWLPVGAASDEDEDGEEDEDDDEEAEGEDEEDEEDDEEESEDEDDEDDDEADESDDDEEEEDEDDDDEDEESDDEDEDDEDDDEAEDEDEDEDEEEEPVKKKKPVPAKKKVAAKKKK